VSPEERLVVALTLREMELRIRVANAIFGVAKKLGQLGSYVAGSTYLHFAEGAEQGAQRITLTASPIRFARGLRLELGDSVEVVRIRKIQGPIVTIDRPLAQAYPPGSKAKVLV
jgi:hypothetical protein